MIDSIIIEIATGYVVELDKFDFVAWKDVQNATYLLWNDLMVIAFHSYRNRLDSFRIICFALLMYVSLAHTRYAPHKHTHLYVHEIFNFLQYRINNG